LEVILQGSNSVSVMLKSAANSTSTPMTPRTVLLVLK